MNYEKIVNPKTGRRVSIYGPTGQKVLRNYISIVQQVHGGGRCSKQLQKYCNNPNVSDANCVKNCKSVSAKACNKAFKNYCKAINHHDAACKKCSTGGARCSKQLQKYCNNPNVSDANCVKNCKSVSAKACNKAFKNYCKAINHHDAACKKC